MGRHEPLTSLALGRSPYDDVVEGEGEADPQEPTREYDEHGRVVNEESKRMNKDIIRSHNEVMLVIGVAEQDPGGSVSTAVDATRLHNEYENSTGRHFLRAGRVLVIAGIWGVHGIRQRVLVYKEAARFPFLDMMQRERRTHTVSQLLFSGMPSFFGAWSLQWYARSSELVRDNPWLRTVIGHIRFHLQIYVAMQRLDLVPSSRWFPSLNFFVPFSSSSPFVAPPPLGSSGAQTLSDWAGNVVISLAPYAGYYLISWAWDFLSYIIRRQIQKSLPHPWPSSIPSPRASAPTNTPPRQSFPESPTLGDADREIRHTQGPELDGDSLAMNNEGVGESLSVGAIRRQGTFSSRGGDGYATDEEDPEMVNPTLISFDVDTSESTEPPAGIWSAELRPSNSGDPRTQEKEAPKYVVNTLTSLPSLLAGDILTSSLTHALLTPLDMLAFRAMARAFSLKFGIPTGHMFEVSLTDGLASRMLLNLFQTEVLKFVVGFGAWAAVTSVAQRFHVTDEEWKEYQLGVERVLEETHAEVQVEAAGTSQST
ncbi:hypothetical protein F5Y12DRAFT_716813 [Xylaria sp. FL1777]|nr:hypothetical protein F5Y12DRAFT_716813 [Xylaria sp. FL1777]